MTVGEIASFLGADVEGSASLDIAGVQSLHDAGPSDISFVDGPRAEAKWKRTQAGCLLVPREFPTAAQFSSQACPALIRVAFPRSSFARVVLLFQPKSKIMGGVDSTANVAASVSLGEHVSVGPMAVIGENAVIGAHTVIGPGCVIGEDARVGEDGLLHAGVRLYPRVVVGARAVLHAGCVIGADGFGFVFENGRYDKFPQVGTVQIGDDVEIGANTCVDRAALGVTSIGNGTKLDNLVHIGHNCRIGRHVVIAAQTGLSGGVEVGDYAVIGGQVGIGDKARIESGAVLGSGCGILTAKIVRAGEPVWGTPARPLRQYLERLALFDRLPRVLKKLDRRSE